VLFGFLLRTVVLLCDNISTFSADYFLKASAVGKQNHWFGLVWYHNNCYGNAELLATACYHNRKIRVRN